MSDKKSNINIARPGENKVYRPEQTNEDRVRLREQHKAQKQHEQNMKEERFAKIREKRRKGKRPSGSGGGAGINIEVTSDGK
jgi:hypothetical protein